MIDRLFLSVGAMKAGTTWLHQQLAGHPGILFCPEKEIHYFADSDCKSYMSLAGRVARYQQVVRNLNPDRLNAHVQNNLAWYASTYLAPCVDDTWYESLFKIPASGKKGARYVADFSNLYATLDQDRWAHVRKVAKSLRVMYTMRHPAKRLWSQLKFSYEFSGRASELQDLSDGDVKVFLTDAGNLAHADYATVVEQLRSYLKEDELRFFFFEDFRSDPVKSLAAIEGFLEIEPQIYQDDRLGKRVNPSQTMAVPESFASGVEKIHQQQIERLTLLGLEVPKSWHEVVA